MTRIIKVPVPNDREVERLEAMIAELQARVAAIENDMRKMASSLEKSPSPKKAEAKAAPQKKPKRSKS